MSAADGEVEDHAQDGGLSPEDIESVFDALHLRRAEVAGLEKESVAFTWTVLGGKWTMEHKGVAYDSYRGQAVDKAGREWAAKYHLTASATFSLSKYGPDTCAVLVQFWCDKMNHYYNISQKHGLAHVFGEVDSSSFVEKADVLALIGHVPAAVELRVQALRAMCPR